MRTVFLAMVLALSVTACSEAQIEAQLRGYVTTFEQGGGQAAAFAIASDIQMAAGMLIYGI